MNSINNFLTEVYAEELFNFSESDYAEVMSASIADDSFVGYSEWSVTIEELMPEGDLENFKVVNGQVRYRGANLKHRFTVGGIEV